MTPPFPPGKFVLSFSADLHLVVWLHAETSDVGLTDAEVLDWWLCSDPLDETTRIIVTDDQPALKWLARGVEGALNGELWRRDREWVPHPLPGYEDAKREAVRRARGKKGVAA